MTRCLLSASVLVLLPAAAAGPALAARYAVTPGAKENLVKFESHAPMETFDGKTREITGMLEFDPGGLADSVGLRLEVDMATLDTGIGMRNTHMRENHLETDAYPKAIFTGGRLVSAASRSLGPEPVSLQVAGILEIHGVANEVVIPAEATLRPDGSVRVLCWFEVKLSDYAISRPKFLMLKLDEVQRVTVDIVAEPLRAPPGSRP